MRTVVITCLLLGALQGWAEDDLLEEAPILEAPLQEAPSSGADSKLRYRAYAFAEGRLKHTVSTGASAVEAPYLEVDLTVDYNASEQWKFFFDGMANHSAYTDAASGSLNQVGVRHQAGADWVFALGRERNRRSPGLFVSPVDFLHANPALAGPREIRTGEWIGRISHQESESSTDLIYVPFRRVTAGGLPNENPRAEGLVRHFRKIGPLDADLATGRIDGVLKTGVSLLGFVDSVWKVYGELGYHGTPLWNGLVGVGYEGSEDFSARAELLYSSDRLQAPVLLPKGWSGVINLGLPEVWDRFNFFFTTLMNFDSRVFVGLVRAEWLLDQRFTLGMSVLRSLNGDAQLSLDFRFSL